MKSISFVFLFFFASPLFSQHEDTLNRDTVLVTSLPQTAYVRNPVMDSLLYQLPSSNSTVTYLPNSLLPSIHSSMSSLDIDVLNFPFILNLISESHYNAKGARQDLKDNRPRILFPEENFTFDSEKDLEFQRKYHVVFFSPGSFDMLGQNKNKKGYNQVIFAYLDKKYGTAWRHELRADAIGFEKPEPLDLVEPEASLQVVRVPNPAPNFHPVLGNDQNVRTQFLIIKIAAVGIVILLIGFFLFRRRKRKF